MELHEWLDQPEHYGKAQALAKYLRLTPGSVSLMRRRGVPMKYMKRVEKFTKRAVRVNAMVAHYARVRGMAE